MRTPRLHTALGALLAAGPLALPGPAAVAEGTVGPGDPVPGFTSLRGDQEPTVAGDGQITHVGVQRDGRIVVAQHGWEGTKLRRLHPDGTPDPTWGTGGVTTLPDWIGDLLVLPDDRVVAADRSLRRFTADGQPDSTFSGDGIAPIPVDPGYQPGIARQVLREDDGALLVVGETYYEAGGDWDVFAARVLPDGSADAGYRAGQHAYCDPADCAQHNLVSGVLAAPDGGVHVVGFSANGTTTAVPRTWLLRPAPHQDGPPVPLPLPAAAHPVLVGGEHAGAGYLSASSDAGSWLARIVANATGVALDEGWGDHGVARSDDSGDAAVAGALQADGRLVLATRRGLVRRHPGGHLDASFRTAPSARTGWDRMPTAVATTADGGILHAGSEWDHDPAARYTPYLDKHVGLLADVSTSIAHSPVAGLSQSAVLTYRNDGPDPAPGAEVRVELGGSLGGTLETSQGTCVGTGGSSSPWTCSLGTIPPGGTVAIQVTLSSSSPATATLTAAGTSTTYDGDLDDRVSGASITTTSPPAAASPTPTTQGPPPVTGPLQLTRLTRPAIKGAALLGLKVKATRGTWSPAPERYRFRWLRNGKAIRKATRATYRITRRDVGRKLSVRVTAVRTGYASASAVSGAVRVRRGQG